MTTRSSGNAPYRRNPFFTGREETLRDLREQLQAQGAIALCHPVGISGLGGIGKTQAAVEYVYRYHDTYTAIFWIQADSLATLHESFQKVVRQLQLPEQYERDQQRVVEAVLQWLHQNSGWLVVFDNMDDLSLAEPFLPKTGQGHRLYTTRAHALGPLAQRVELQTMDVETGALLLLRRASLLPSQAPLHLASEAQKQGASAISHELDGLPLALDQAGAYIKEQACSLENYLAEYRARHQDLLQTRANTAQAYPFSVATTWSLSFGKVRQTNVAASELLNFCAFLAPDAIPESLITRASPTFRNPWVQSVLGEIADDPISFDHAMETLLRYSLITRYNEEGLFSIHRLVQTVIRDAATTSEKTDMINMQVVPVLRDTFPDPEQIEHWKDCARYIPHVLAGMQWIVEDQLFFESIAELLFKAGSYLQKQGRYPEAEQVYTLCLQIFRDCGEDIGVAAVLNMLGMIHQVQRRYQQAEEAYQQAEGLLQAQSEDVSFILDAIQNNRADLYRDQGKFQQAADLYEQPPLKQREQSEETDLDRATTLNNRALLLTNQGKYEEAEPLHQEALAIRREKLGSVHPDVANSLNNLAGLYRLQGRYSEAEQHYLQALSIMEQHYGKEHPTIAFTLNNLGELYRQMEQYERAEEYLARAMAIRDKQVSPFRSHSLTSLGSLYIAQGKYAQGETALRQALELQERDLGSEHIDIATTLNNLGTCCLHQGKIAEAEGYLMRSLAMKEKLLGKHHPELVWSLNNLASLCQMQKKYAQAEDLYRRAMEIQEQFPGAPNLGLAKIITNIGELYRVQRKYKQAQQALEKALNIYMESKDPESEGSVHVDMAKVLNNLGLLADEKKLFAIAEQFYQAAIAVNERFLGADHPELAFPLYNLASLYQRHGLRTEAETRYQRVLAICEEHLGNEHLFTQQVRDSYAEFLAQEPSGSKKPRSWLKLPRFKR